MLPQELICDIWFLLIEEIILQLDGGPEANFNNSTQDFSETNANEQWIW